MKVLKKIKLPIATIALTLNGYMLYLLTIDRTITGMNYFAASALLAAALNVFVLFTSDE